MSLILASQSPRRRELLGLFKMPFTVKVADIDEAMNEDLPAAEEVARVSRLKAEAIEAACEDVVIAADTIVVLDGHILGKPADEADAVRMLTALSGKSHQVMTGVTVKRGSRCITHTEITDIHFRELSPKEIEDYVRTGEPMDKAGAYGIQGGAALFADKMHGDYYNVMGLPVCALHGMLRKIMEDNE